MGRTNVLKEGMMSFVKAGASHNLGLVIALGLLLAFACVVLPGCGASSQLSNMWLDHTYSDGPLKNVLVISISKDAARRRLWEDEIVAALTAHGVSAVPSHQLFPEAVPDTAKVVAAIREQKYDGVITISRLETRDSTKYVSGYTTREPVTRWNPWNHTYDTYYQDVRHPGYTETQTVERREVNVWATKEKGRMVWCGTGEVIDPTSHDAIRGQVTGLIAPELARQGLIPPKS